ncbi:HP0495 family protein [Helicobacter bizzozeronii]|uniref:HP0495 family protein n=1 Tax=Helicobacter bizzozeronii TaxID=56877 RepID=UPI000CF1AE64|nr:DUF493 domain-containing protein [Helicobacter bizzozeronii]
MDSNKPQITYPTLWEYRLITDDPRALLEELPQILGRQDYKADLNHMSAHGKYTSLQLCLEVASQEERDRLFSALSTHAFVKWVL